MFNLPIPKFHVIGHRGVAGLRPENTLCSFRHAAELGLNWIEFDVQLTADDYWVVMHDDTVERTTDGRGSVRKWTKEELGQLEAGLWFKPTYPGERVPSLLDTLQLAKELKLYCVVEIKTTPYNYEKFAVLFTEFVQEYSALCSNILVTSFDVACIIKLRDLLPDLPIGLNIDNFNADTIPTIQKHNFANINCSVKKITKDNLQAATTANIPVFLFTINDQITANFWLQQGSSAIFSDRPDLLMPA